MKNLLLIMAFIALSLYIKAQSLGGTVTDSISHENLAGAVVSIPQLKLGSSADAKGNYKITNLPDGTYQLEVILVGYATVTQQVTIKGDATVNFKMIMSCCMTSECVVTAVGNVTDIQRTPMPVTIVPHETLVEETSGTVIDAIATQPGVNMTTEGAGTTKPQINGLGFDRVLALTDGLRQEDFQWGDDHGLLIDPYAVYDAEIIRGPASLQYGASAEAGVISFKTEPFAESGTVQGSVLTEYQTNNGYIGTSLGIGGNHNGFVWNLRASNEETHDYWDTKDGYVWGTAWQQDNLRLTLGLNERWGYSRLTFSSLHRRIQVPDGNRDSTGAFEFDFPQNGKVYPTRSNFLAYDPSIASDKILDEDQVWWQNSFNAGRGTIGLDVGFTESEHHDIDTGTVGAANFHVQDIPYSLKYQVADDSSGLKLTAGVNGTYEFQENYAAPPPPYIPDYEIPDYTDFQIGGFVILQKDYKNLTLSGGLRYDYNNFVGKGMYLDSTGHIVSANATDAMLQFSPFNNSYTGPSGSIGASYQLPDYNYLKLNVSKSYRAPSIDQITSNGVNIGVNAFQTGSIDLKAEQGYQVDFAYGNNGRNVSFEADGFYNRINNFIFPVRIAGANGGDSITQGLPTYLYQATTAIIEGVAGYFNIHPSVDGYRWIEIDNGFTYTYSYLPNQTDSTNHLPFTPAPRLTSEVKLKLNDKSNSIFKSTYIKFGIAKYWEQDNIYSALGSELPSAAYSIYNAGVGTNFVNRKTKRVICSFYVNCTNLMNLGYADHLNLAQYFHTIDRNVVTVTNPSQGVYNMGRNVGFKLIFPIGGHTASETEAKGPRDN